MSITLTVVPAKRGRPKAAPRKRCVELDKTALEALSNTQFTRARITPCDPAEVPEKVLAEEHHVDPIQTAEDVSKIIEHLYCTGQWREYMLITVGVNTGLRYSDLSTLRFSDLMDQNGYFYDEITLTEKKNGTKVVSRGTDAERRIAVKNRHIYINEAVRQAVTIFLANNERKWSDLLFESKSNNRNAYSTGKPLCNSSFGDIIKKAAKEAGVSGNFNTHTLRKTFGCNFMKQNANDPDAIYKLMMIFGHTDARITMRYIGMTDEVIRNSYKNLNLGELKAIAKNNSMTFVSDDSRGNDNVVPFQAVV